MADQWYYAKGRQQHGPISSEQLREVAQSGELLPTDLVWKTGMADWQPAGLLKGFFPNHPPTAAAYPSAAPNPVPPSRISPRTNDKAIVGRPSSSSPGVKDRFRAFLDTAQDAGRLVARQTERTKLAKVELPAAFRALGKDVFETRRFDSEFPQHFQRLDALSGDLAAIQARAAEAPSPSTLAEKAKHAAKTAKVTAEAKSVELKLVTAYTELGKLAFQSHGAASGPETLIRPVQDALARLESLDAEIAMLSERGTGSWITPKRLAVAGVAATTVVLAGLVWAMMGIIVGTPGIANVDFSSGPNGEEVFKVEEDKRVVWGFRDESGNFVRHGRCVEFFDQVNGTKRSEGHYYAGQPHGEIKTWFDSGELESERWFNKGQGVGTHKGYARDGSVAWEYAFASDGTPLVQDATCESFIYQVAYLYRTNTWRWFHLNGEDATVYRFTNSPRSEIPFSELVRILGKPHELHNGDQWHDQEWAYRCRDGVVVCKLTNYAAIPNHNSRDAVVMTETKVNGLRTF